MGGLSRKAYLIGKLRHEVAAPTLLVDSGNILFKKWMRPGYRQRQRIKARGILQVYKEMGYVAMAVGPHDLSDGMELLMDSKRQGTPWVSANILDSKNATVFQPWVIAKTAFGRIGIIGLTASDAKVPAGFHVAPWQQVMPGNVAKLFARCDFLMVLSNMGDADNIALAERFPQIDLLVSSVRALGNRSPQLVGNTLLTQTHYQGKYLGSICIHHWFPSGLWQGAAKKGSKTVAGLLDATTGALAAAQRQPQDKGAALLRLRNQQRTLQELRAGATPSKPFASFSYRFYALRDTTPDLPAISKEIEQLKRQINRTPVR